MVHFDLGILTYLYFKVLLCNVKQNIMNLDKGRKAASLINRQYYNFSNFDYRTKLSRLAFLANALSTSFVGQCSRWHCSKRSTSSRSSVMIEQMDVSVRCRRRAQTRTSLRAAFSSAQMVSSRQTFGKLTLLQLLMLP